MKGQISATLTHLSSELDRMEALTRTETNMTKREKHTVRYRDLQSQYHEVKRSFEVTCARMNDSEAAAVDSRRELLGRRPYHNATPENPYASSAAAAGRERERDQVSREQGNVQESAALHRMGGILDEYIESGLASLGDLRDQSTALKGTQRRLRDIAVGLGLSGNTIRLIERRTKGDKWIFYGGCLLTFICFYFILKWFG